MKDHECVGENNQGLSVVVGQSAKCLVDLGFWRLEGPHRKLEHLSRALNLLVFRCLVTILRIVEDGDAGERGNEFFEQLKPFRRQFG